MEGQEMEELTENNLEGVEGAGSESKSESELQHLLWEITCGIGDSDA